MVALAGFLLISLIVVLCKDWVTAYYASKSPLFGDYYFYLIPTTLALLLHLVVEKYLISEYKSVWAGLVRDVLFRIWTLVAIGLFHFGWIGFDHFVALYLAANAFMFIALLIYAMLQGRLSLGKSGFRLGRLRWRMIRYGGYTVLNSLNQYLKEPINTLMLAGYQGLNQAAVYKVSGYFTQVISAPSRSMMKVVYSVLADKWKNRDLEEIHSLYKKISNVNLVFSGLVLLGILINLDFIFSVLIVSGYEKGAGVIFILGIGVLYNQVAGINERILLSSDDYRYNLYFNILALLINVLGNHFLIRPLGVLGPALAGTISTFFLQTAIIWFVWKRYRMQPFSWKTLQGVLFLVLAYLLGAYLPVIKNPYIDLFVRSSLSGGLYLSLVYFLKVSPEFNDYLEKNLGKVWKLLGNKRA